MKCAADLRSVLPALQEKIVASAAADAVSLVKQVHGDGQPDIQQL